MEIEMEERNLLVREGSFEQDGAHGGVHTTADQTQDIRILDLRGIRLTFVLRAAYAKFTKR
jgi:hypothetical protein